MTRSRFIIARALLLLAVAGGVGAVALTRDVPSGETFATNGINLKIDSKSWYNGVLVPSATWKLKDLVPGVDKFYNFDDIKPGDQGCTVVSMHVKNEEAWLCLDFKSYKSSENGVNEPEGEVDADATGELGDGTEFFGWHDDGDGKFEPPKEKAIFGTSTQAASSVLNNKTYSIGDSKQGNSCKPNTTKYVGMCWCAGNLVVNPTTGKMTCDPTTLGNEAQTDSWSVDIAVRAESFKNKKSFLCSPKQEEKKVKICHYTGKKSDPTEIIEVVESALSGHLAHKDFVVKTKDDEKKCKNVKKNNHR